MFWTNSKLSLFIILLILLIFIISPVGFSKIKAQIYQVFREIYKLQVVLETQDYKKISDNKILVKYTGIDKKSASLVLETMKEVYKPVNNLLGFKSESQVPIIIYPSMEALNKSFGWEGDKSPMGVYWMGTIRILAPEAWIEEDNYQSKREIFKQMGPMAHEYAHLVVDYKTNGNYTRWFTEGIAQYVEKKLTGFTLDEPIQEAKRNIYPFSQLDKNFDDQPDEKLAYWQSLKALEYLVNNYGENVINDLLIELSKGKNMNQAFINITGLNLNEFEKKVRIYCQGNI